jgi:hypothetical protein
MEDKGPTTVAHEAATTARAGQPLRIAARVSDPDGVQWVRLRYRPLNQTMDYATLEMARVGETDRYEATVPGEAIDPAWDFMYFIETMDRAETTDGAGHGTHWPDFNRQSPYVIVPLAR